LSGLAGFTKAASKTYDCANADVIAITTIAATTKRVMAESIDEGAIEHKKRGTWV
jgi:hypothetical protein